MRKYYENYEDYDAAVAQATGIIKHLRKTFDMDTIRMAFKEVLDESRKPNKRRVKESEIDIPGTATGPGFTSPSEIFEFMEDLLGPSIRNDGDAEVYQLNGFEVSVESNLDSEYPTAFITVSDDRGPIDSFEANNELEIKYGLGLARNY